MGLISDFWTKYCAFGDIGVAPVRLYLRVFFAFPRPAVACHQTGFA